MPMSTEAINRAVGEILEIYKSSYTGEELEAALKQAAELQFFVDANLAPPVAAMTGDFQVATITTLTRSMWLDSITLTCVRAFSASSTDITYQIALSTGATLINIPNDFMRDQGTTLVYRFNQLIDTGTAINMLCSSTRAFGEVSVKLNLT